jgi:riboflavin kinase / FMN adenylyltransferase
VNEIRPAIVTIGNFDGVHLGHQMLLHQVVDRAHALDLTSFAVTFEPHPEQVLFPERKLPHLSTSDERCEMLRECGIDEVWVCPFTSELARLEPEDFIRLVIERQPIAELWVGADFAMGRGRRGSIAVLAEIGSHLGWGLHMVPPYRLEDQVVSSTAVRTLLGAGAVRGAADLLGRNYSVTGLVSADGVLQVDPLRALPRPGLTYEAQVHQANRTVESRAQVLPELGRVQIFDAAAAHPGDARVEFTRRLD